jgi:hypothetical protein
VSTRDEDHALTKRERERERERERKVLEVMSDAETIGEYGEFKRSRGPGEVRKLREMENRQHATPTDQHRNVPRDLAEPFPLLPHLRI